MHRDGPVPEQPQQRPRIRPGYGGQMHKRRQSPMTPVSRVQVEELQDENHLGGPEVVARPEEDPAEVEEVVEDEVGGDVGGGRY